jgi:hypothetical protein
MRSRAREKEVRDMELTTLEQIDATPTAATPPDMTRRLRAIRAGLPGQMLRERLQTARVCYGMLYTEAEIRKKVADTLPPRVGFVRGAVLEPIETYSRPIPDQALIKYDDAIQTGVFSRFLVATPRYYGQRQVDPWIVGQVVSTELWAVIAQWDVADREP